MAGPPAYAFASAGAHASSQQRQGDPVPVPAHSRPTSPYANLSRSSSPLSMDSPHGSDGARTPTAQGTTPLLGYGPGAGLPGRLQPGAAPSQLPRGAAPSANGYLSRSSSGESSSSAAGMIQPGRPRYGPTVQPPSMGYARGAVPSSASDFSVNSKGGYARSPKVAAAAYPGSPGSLAPSIKDKFSLSADPGSWGAEVNPAHAEPDDYLHNPDPKRDRRNDHGGTIFTPRGLMNVGCLIVLGMALITLFAGYPIITYYTTKATSTLGAYNLGGVNATGQVAATIGNFGLIDKDTPQSAYTHTSLETGATWDLVFSDEFDTEGRTFYPGDDPFWEAEDLHYWSTNNLEWYSPERLTTKGGKLVVTLDKFASHGLDYEGGLMNSWNKFCFRGGYIESSISLPGKSSVYGLWPALWTLGNLGRAAYGGTLDSMWPYSYDSCDVGTLANQTLNGLPTVALTTGPEWSPYNGTLSYLEGQRLSSCTCPNDESHPGPRKSDGTFKGRSAPEIDVIEAQVDHTTLLGHVSQSAQWAPFNPYYYWINDSSTYEIMDPTVTQFNSYLGGVYQQATSGVVMTDQNCYTDETGCFSIYGFEYAPGDNGYIRWVSDGKQSWMIRGAAMGPNSEAGVSQRPVPEEPMYILINLGLSENFGTIDYAGLESLWPVHMEVDYVRVYQDPNNIMIGCDPADMPTASYIEKYYEAYTNPNITTFDQIPAGHPPRPKNRLIDTC